MTYNLKATCIASGFFCCLGNFVYLNMLLGTPQISFGLSNAEWSVVLFAIGLVLFIFLLYKAMKTKLHEVNGDQEEY